MLNEDFELSDLLNIWVILAIFRFLLFMVVLKMLGYVAKAKAL